MIFKKSVKQFLRTPGKLLLFILLFAVAAFFLTAGAMLWARNRGIIAAYEKTFVTIGRVEQLPDHHELVRRAAPIAVTIDACPDETATWESVAIYGETLTPSVLDFEGANYVVAPEHRPYYGAWRPDLALINDVREVQGVVLTQGSQAAQPYIDYPVIEFTPLEDWADGAPINIQINRVLNEIPYDDSLLIQQYRHPHEGTVVQYHDHYSAEPTPLEKGKNYIAILMLVLLPDGQFEYSPGFGSLKGGGLTSQYGPDGTRLETDAPGVVQEVTEGFYDTRDGQWWLSYSAQIADVASTIPVIPVGGTEHLTLFYNKVAYLVDGEDITIEEYTNGDYVCLVSDRFAQRNGLTVGDTLRLPLYFADYAHFPGDLMGEDDPPNKGYGCSWLQPCVLNAKGEHMAVFSDHEYTIRGIYTSPTLDGSRFSLGANAVVIPSASVRESDADNIVGYGRMTELNTSFQIENGGIERFMALWEQQGVENLRITFFDRGYNQVQRGLQNMKRTATLFLIIGCAMTVVLLLFFCNLFITKNKPRTAVERMLGYTKKQCAMSLLAGFLLAALVATVLGCGAGYVAEGRLSRASLGRAYYMTDFTLGQTTTMEIDVNAAVIDWVCPLAAVALLAVTYAISKLFMSGNLKEEPLLMLGQKNE